MWRRAGLGTALFGIIGHYSGGEVPRTQGRAGAPEADYPDEVGSWPHRRGRALYGQVAQLLGFPITADLSRAAPNRAPATDLFCC